MQFGLTLPNRGVLMGAVTVEQMIEAAEVADRSELFHYLWVGDSLFGKPRMESVTLLSGLATRTKRLLMGPACMASFPLRDPVLLAYQWASLDLLAGGRTVLIACTGIVPQAGGELEARLYGVANKDRVGRLVEWVTILKRLWTEDNVTFEGKHYRFEGVTVEPKPAAKPRPAIWIANNSFGPRATVEQTHRRVVRHADGWMTSLSDLPEVAWRRRDIEDKAREEGRDPSKLHTALYHNINVNEDQGAAHEESKRFLDAYYMVDMPAARVASWTAAGSPKQCIEHLRAYKELGFQSAGLRVTSWNQISQLRRVINEVLPYV